MSEIKIIDNHCHYRKVDGYLDEMLEKSAEAGVEWLCLNGGGERWRQHDNRGIMAAAEAHPDRIIPIAFVHLGEDSAADVRAWQSAGFRGLKTQCPIASYDDEAFFPVYEAAEELRMPILFHTGISARFIPEHDRWNTSSRFMMPLTFDRIARCFPDLTLWGAHLGVPDTWHAAMMMAVHPHVYFDLCGPSPTWTSLFPWDQLFYKGEEHWGKLIYGTEGGPAGFAPLRDYYLKLLRDHDCSQETIEKVMWHNAAQALGIERH